MIEQSHDWRKKDLTHPRRHQHPEKDRVRTHNPNMERPGLISLKHTEVMAIMQVRGACRAPDQLRRPGELREKYVSSPFGSKHYSLIKCLQSGMLRHSEECLIGARQYDYNPELEDYHRWG